MHWSCPTRRVCGKGIPTSAWCEQLVLGLCLPGAEPLLLAARESWDSVVWLGSLAFAGEEETTGATLLCFHSIATTYSALGRCVRQEMRQVWYRGLVGGLGVAVQCL